MGVFWIILWAVTACAIYLAVNPDSWLFAIAAIIISGGIIVLIDYVASKVGIYRYLPSRMR